MNDNLNNQQPMQTQQPLKQCKYCKRGIDRAAKVCPYCNREQSSAAKIVFAILFAFIVFGVLCVYVFPPLWEEFFPKESASTNNPVPYNYTYQTSPPTTQPTTAEPINKLIYDANDIKIFYKGASVDDRRVMLHLYIENNSDRNICVQTRDFSVNGFMIKEIFTPQIAAGKKINDSIRIYTKELDENNIETINNVEFYFHIFNWDDSEDRIDSDLIRLEG